MLLGRGGLEPPTSALIDPDRCASEHAEIKIAESKVGCYQYGQAATQRFSDLTHVEPASSPGNRSAVCSGLRFMKLRWPRA